MAKYLVNTARPLIFSTALGPPAVAAAMAALELLREEPRRVEKLQRNASVLREALAGEGLPAAPGQTHILPVVIGDAADALSVSERALERGVFAQAIRPPTVPEGTSRLRLTVMASHTKAELREAAKRLAIAVPSSVRKVAAGRALQAQAAADAAAADAGVRRSRIFDGLADAA